MEDVTVSLSVRVSQKGSERESGERVEKEPVLGEDRVGRARGVS